MAGPRGFEPRVSGFGGLRTFLVGWFGALIQSGLRAPLCIHPVPLCKLSFVASCLCGDVFGGFLGAYLLRYRGLAVGYYGCTLGALNLQHPRLLQR